MTQQEVCQGRGTNYEVRNEDDRIELVEAIRKRINRGTASAEDERVFQKFADKDPSTVPLETPEKREQRLAKQQKLTATRRKNETTEQRHRRLVADRIRAKLRRMDWHKGNLEERKKLKDTLYALKGYTDKGWKKETDEEWKRRIGKERQRRKKKKVAQQLDCNLITACKMVSAMREWEAYEQELARFHCRLKESMTSAEFTLLSRGLRLARTYQEHHFLKKWQEAQGMLFSIDTALSVFERKHALVPMKRRRPKWMITPPVLNDSTVKEIRVMVLALHMRPKGWWCKCQEETEFQWSADANSGAGEWLPIPGRNYDFVQNEAGEMVQEYGRDYEFTETGYRFERVYLPFGHKHKAPPQFGEKISGDPLCSAPQTWQIQELKKQEKRCFPTTSSERKLLHCW